MISADDSWLKWHLVVGWRFSNDVWGCISPPWGPWGWGGTRGERTSAT